MCFFSFFSYSVVERELNVPLPISKIIKKWNNLLQEYKVSWNVCWSVLSDNVNFNHQPMMAQLFPKLLSQVYAIFAEWEN